MLIYRLQQQISTKPLVSEPKERFINVRILQSVMDTNARAEFAEGNLPSIFFLSSVNVKLGKPSPSIPWSHREEK